MNSSTPSIAELKAVTQPESLLGRAVGEHWAGRLYMRRLSPYVTRLLIRTPLTANGVTWLMIATGLLAAVTLSFPGLWAAFGAAALVQLQLLLDCCDGEIARWRHTFSPAGIYLDQLGHYLTNAALPAALGIRADGGWDSLGGWTTVGLSVSVLVLVINSEGHLVYLARGLAGPPDTSAASDPSGPQPAALQRLRRAADFAPFFRAFRAVDATLLAVVAAIVDAAGGNLAGSRALLLLLVPAAALTAAGHLVMILTSGRLR
jgi:phosphatidylglycerophosphate synthase